MNSCVLIILYLVLPAIAATRIIAPLGLFSSPCLQIAAPFLLGHVVSTIAITVLATLLVLVTDGVLLWATLLVLALAALCAAPAFKSMQAPPRYVRLASLLFCTVAYCIFSVHLTVKETAVFASPVYWDFPCHLTSIQGFVHGDNFPPQMEVYAGVFQTYHFLANIPMAIFSALGLHPAHAITWYSVVAFTVLLLTIVGVCEEIFTSTAAGLIAVLLALTSSSLRFIDFFRRQDWTSPLTTFQQILTNDLNPYTFSFELSSPYGYQGVMYNLFYFIEERQLLVPAAVFLLTPLIFQKLTELSLRACVALGIGLGLFLLWHAFITAAIAASLLFLIPLNPQRLKATTLLAASAVVAGPLIWLMHSTLSLPEFQALKQEVPRLNFDFISDPRLDFYFSIPNLVGFYLYGYGLKIFTAATGLFMLRTRSRASAQAFATLVITTFTLTNTLQIAPNSISENHKWLRSLGLLLDILSAGALVMLARRGAKDVSLIPGALVKSLNATLLMALLTISGVIEAIPFLRSVPSEQWLYSPSPFDDSIHRNSRPQDVFATSEPQRVVFSGRRVYTAPISRWRGNSFAYHSIVDDSQRLERQDDLLFEYDPKELCRKARELGIQVVEISSDLAEELRAQVPEDALFEVELEDALPLTFFHAGRGC